MARHLKIIGISCSLLLTISIAVAFGGWHWLQTQWDTPAVTTESILEIPRGTSVRDIGRQLQTLDIAPYHWLYPVLVRLENLPPKSGEYLLTPDASLRDIANILHRGVSVLHAITIPEGSNWKQIRTIINENTLLDMALFEKLLAEFIAAQPALDTFEGAVYPETYLFAKVNGEQELMRQIQAKTTAMLAQFPTPEAAREGLILASIIEKEAGNREEMPLIASVFYNRIKRGMRLQSDPTVIYGMFDSYDGTLLRGHLQTDTPHNTYTRNGLPPTPICSPSAAAINAVLLPAQTNYIFFVADGRGGHAFSATLQEHNRYVQQYRALMRNR
ncbi:endolytic transglycosylase MltG [Chrysiogenes arsenatis]|uniref:endolytic transglycosylase MltG n=1 Tax=Chrysiogenes arsenatis TaxID=309797 RepID=UPI0004112384|nr:endolytic transglycosylase MltG [Chrysiogenes arsenatis]